jgi:Ca-activated chloride channel family protein
MAFSAAGIELAYEVAQENFISGGNNRVILATDGDFNVGPSSDAEMTRLIEEKRESGVFLTTLGLGTGNLQDAKMEALANKGNGNYFYLDAPREAKKVLGRQLTSTLHTIAKDVKIQVEFNPTEVERYRLIGYANRQLDKEDFADDSTDAGELGMGHTVTALYEVVPGSKSGGDAQRDDLRYQTDRGLSDEARSSGEMMQVRLRYKQPDGDTSRLIEQAVPAEKSNAHPEYFRFSAAVVGFGMLLRDSEYRGDLTTDQVLELARDGRGDDPYGDRAEFIQLVERFRRISQQNGERSVSQQR